MKKVIAWPVAWLLYWTGCWSSNLLNVLPDRDAGVLRWVGEHLALYYQWSMSLSCRVDTWGDVGIWGPPGPQR